MRQIHDGNEGLLSATCAAASVLKWVELGLNSRKQSLVYNSLKGFDEGSEQRDRSFFFGIWRPFQAQQAVPRTERGVAWGYFRLHSSH